MSQLCLILAKSQDLCVFSVIHQALIFFLCYLWPAVYLKRTANTFLIAFMVYLFCIIISLRKNILSVDLLHDVTGGKIVTTLFPFLQDCDYAPHCERSAWA